MTHLRILQFQLFIAGKSILLFLLLIGVFACSSYEKLSIQVLTPAEEPLLSGIGKYRYLNRIPSLYDEHDTIRTGSIDLPSSYLNFLSWQIVNSSLDVIDRTPLKDSVKIDTIIYEEFFKAVKGEVLDSVFISELCLQESLKGVISLEELSLWDTVFFMPQLSYLDADSLMNAKYYYCVNMILPRVKWRIYSYTGQMENEYLMKDTLIWYSVGETEEDAWYFLPETETILNELASAVGAGFSKKVIPVWTDVNRVFYHRGSIELIIAAKLVQKNSWDEAARIWQKAAESENKGIASKAAFNMALACELSDRLELALTWINKSWNIEKNDLAVAYSKVLRDRVKKSQMVNKQLK